MSAFIDYLRSFNRKERFLLVGRALGNRDFQLGKSFRQQLGDRFALDVPSNAFVAMDYHLDWIYASAYLSQEGVNASGVHPNAAGLVSGNQEDVDLIVAFDAGETTHLIMLEAKAETGWTKKQTDSKVKRLTAIFGKESNTFPQLQPRFGLMSPRQPSRLKADYWPSWMRSPEGGPLWMKLAFPPGRRKPTRWDNDSDKQSKNGDYFKVESTDKKQKYTEPAGRPTRLCHGRTSLRHTPPFTSSGPTASPITR